MRLTLGRHHVRVAELVCGLSSALDLVSPALVHHHRQVLGISAKIAAALGMGGQSLSDVLIAAMLHDIGVVAFNRGIDLKFDDVEINDHAELGYQLIRWFEPFAQAAELVRYHHGDWRDRSGPDASGPIRPLGSSIIHLADRIAVQVVARSCVLTQGAAIRSWVGGVDRHRFAPEVVEAFLGVSGNEQFWFELLYEQPLQNDWALSGTTWDLVLDTQGLKKLSELFRMIIDFRSAHTASHSRRVARISAELARIIGFSGAGCNSIQIAGNLHDIGKLALPKTILDKPGPLTPAEHNIVKVHAFHTYRILSQITGLDEICTWAACHHECPDGSGYPRQLRDEQIPLGARIVAVADTFSALMELRPYRQGLPKAECLRIMLAKAADGKLHPMPVALVEKNFDELYELQLIEQQTGIKEYQQLLKEAQPRLSPGRQGTGKAGRVMA